MFSIVINVTGRPSAVVANGFKTSLDALKHLARLYPETRMVFANKYYRITNNESSNHS